MLIGILSDTHGLLRQEVIDGLEGVDHIIHAGDIDNKQVIDRLEEIAPITVVRGNADKEWAEYLPETATLELLGNKIYVIHNKGKIFDDLAGISIIIYGHSHKYSLVEKNGQAWFNPGCCGKRKPDQEVSFAIPDDMDKRKQRIFVTDKCRTFLEQNDNNGQQSRYVIGRIFNGIDEKSLQTTIQTIMKMERNLSEL